MARIEAGEAQRAQGRGGAGVKLTARDILDVKIPGITITGVRRLENGGWAITAEVEGMSCEDAARLININATARSGDTLWCERIDQLRELES